MLVEVDGKELCIGAQHDGAVGKDEPSLLLCCEALVCENVERHRQHQQFCQDYGTCIQSHGRSTLLTFRAVQAHRVYGHTGTVLCFADLCKDTIHSKHPDSLLPCYS